MPFSWDIDRTKCYTISQIQGSCFRPNPYVTDQDSQAVARDLKKTYQAATLLEAEQALEDFAQAWQASYPTIIKMW